MKDEVYKNRITKAIEHEYARERRWKSIYITLCIVAVLALLSIAHSIGYQDGVLQHDIYCKNVKNNIHPDYDGIYKEYCNDV